MASVQQPLLLVQQTKAQLVHCLNEMYRHGCYLVSIDQSHENTSDTFECLWRWCWGFVAKPCHKFDWYSNEPVYHEHGDYNCGLFKRSYKYHWHVDSCGQKNHYVAKNHCIDRALRRHRYEASIMQSPDNIFTATKQALKAKQKDLKQKGKGIGHKK
uniref:Uncharacterized protein n=1 Tax=Magallana gigas TaxID=29159 RepID=A0A8W8NL80_MAGGI